MKARANLIVLGLAFVAGCVLLQAPSYLVYSSGALSSSVERLPSGPNRTAGKGAAKSYGDLPLSFEVNRGQSDSRVKFLSRSSGYNLYLTDKEAVIGLRAPAPPAPKNAQRTTSPTTPEHSSFVRMKLVGAGAAARIIGLDELPGKSNYFIGNDPKKWRTNIPNFSRVKYENVYPGVDAVFYGEHGQLEYDVRVAPGADFKTVRIAFDGVRRVRLDGSGDLLIATSNGEIRQRKPVIYQEADGAKQPVEGGYVIRGEREVGFEVRRYDSNRALVIDPVMAYSTTFGGSYNESANAIAVDKAGNAYIAGTTNSQDFPTVNPFQPNLKIGVAVGIPSDAFVAKLNPSGTALLYSTYLGGGSIDGANGIAVDLEGNAYVTGYAASTEFPTSPGAFQTKASSGGDAFISKLNPMGNALAYSTRLGGPPGSFGFNFVANNGLGIAVDTKGSAYVTGYTFSPSFPVKKAVQDEIDRGTRICCFRECLYREVPLPSPAEDAFVTKLNPSGTGLAYSTYVGGTGQEEGYAIAVDSSGSAYVTGRTCSRDFASGGYGGGRSDAFIVKLSASGKEFVSSRLLGGDGDDVGNAITIDSDGNAYVAGQTDSINFQTSQFAFQPRLAGSVSYVTADGGGGWSATSGLPNSPVNVLAVDPTNSQTVYAGLGDCLRSAGVFKSTDGGNTWRSSGLAQQIIEAIGVDPKQSSTVYAGTSKSTDGGASWTTMTFPGPNAPLFGAATIAIDPIDTATVYLSPRNFIICSDFVNPSGLFKSTDSGGTWNQVRNGPSPFGVDSLVIDPKNPATLYATSGNLFKSTDAGNTWRVPYQGNRNLVALAIDPNNTSTLYFRDTPSNINSLFKTTDGGMSFSVMGLTGVPIKGLVVDPTNSSTLYAATGDLGNGGGVFKSTDGGQTWKATDLTGVTVNALAIDPLNSSRIYAGTFFDTDGFLAKVNAAGDGLVYSTYIGTRSPDVVAGLGIDAAGNSYVTGKTFSDRFPTKDALLPTKAGGPFDTATFITKLDVAGSAILFSTYLGGNEPSFGSAIAVDTVGKAYVAGTTGLRALVPSARLPESAHGGFDAFVIKIGSAPRISGASISGKNLIVAGEGFDQGAVILVGGVEQRSKNYEPSPATALIGKKAAKNIAPGQTVPIQVRNSDGLISETFSFTR